MTPQDRSNPKPPLHNFSLPYLKWGNQKLLRCVKLTNTVDQSAKPVNLGDSANPSIPIHENQNPSSSSSPHLNGIGTKRLIKVSPLVEENRNGNGNGNGNGHGIDDSSRPWNLRTRRAACKAPPLRIEDKKNVYNFNNNYNNNSSPGRILEIDSPRRKLYTSTVKEKVKLSVPLSKDEIEQDFIEIARIRPPRRPKKRPKYVQKYLDSIFPGLWLSEVTPDAYKVPEVPDS